MVHAIVSLVAAAAVAAVASRWYRSGTILRSREEDERINW